MKDQGRSGDSYVSLSGRRSPLYFSLPFAAPFPLLLALPTTTVIALKISIANDARLLFCGDEFVVVDRV